MAFKPGNKFWEARATNGRDLIFQTPELLWEACVEYFNWVHDNPLMEAKPFSYQGESWVESVSKMRAMSKAGLCIFLDIDETTWDLYRKRDDFIGVTTKVESIIRTQKLEGAAADLLNPNIIARDLRLKDTSEIEHTSPDGSMSPKDINPALVSALVDKLIN